MRDFSGSRFVNGQGVRPILFRRIILELWALFVLACLVGAMGPFGTYLQDHLAGRIGQWWMMLLGAYLLVRPMIPLLRRIAVAAQLSVTNVSYWGVALSSIPLAVLWKLVGRNAFRHLDGFASLIPFSLLCAASVMVIVKWAEHTELRLRRPRDAETDAPDIPHFSPAGDQVATEPPLFNRLPAAFRGPILALQSEDHYVRVHGQSGSALLLMRLRDAIAEMDGVAGEQVHRSWWVSREAASGVEPSGRSWVIRLTNGACAPVARDSATRLKRTGFLPSDLAQSE